MYLHFGRCPTLVVFSSSMAEELITKCDIVFAKRPNFLAGEHIGYDYTDDIVKGLITNMFTAGTDTSSLTMDWAMSLMLNNPDVPEKATSEINDNVKEGCFLEDADLPKLVYLHCIINETLRLFPVAPLLVPHSSSRNCTINGYRIASGTNLIVNAWAIHRDPDVWEEASKFMPERFEGTEAGNEGFKFLPFGKGRRACPAMNMAMRFMGLGLWTFIQCFEWKRMGVEMLDLKEKKGVILTIQRDKPLQVLYKPRLQLIKCNFSNLNRECFG